MSYLLFLSVHIFRRGKKKGKVLFQAMQKYRSLGKKSTIHFCITMHSISVNHLNDPV